jgi:hypothetical protein
VRSPGWLLSGYALAVCVVVALLLAGHTEAARAWALVPFAVLLAAVVAGRYRPGRVCVVTGLIATAVMVLAFASSAADLIAEAGLAVGTLMLTAAVLRARGSTAMRRHRWVLITFAPLGALVFAWAAIGLAAELPQALHPPPHCVDTCFGPGIGVLLGSIILAELLLLAMTVVALVTSPIIGPGAVILTLSQNALFFMAPPSAAVTYSIAIAAWYTGLVLFAWPWIGRGESGIALPAVGR